MKKIIQIKFRNLKKKEILFVIPSRNYETTFNNLYTLLVAKHTIIRLEDQNWDSTMHSCVHYVDLRWWCFRFGKHVPEYEYEIELDVIKPGKNKKFPITAFQSEHDVAKKIFNFQIKT